MEHADMKHTTGTQEGGQGNRQRVKTQTHRTKTRGESNNRGTEQGT